MRRAQPKTMADAWDFAEKVFAERGRPWSVNRRGGGFWIESDDVKVTVTDKDGPLPHFVVNLYLQQEMLSWSMTYPAALELLLEMIDRDAQRDGQADG